MGPLVRGERAGIGNQRRGLAIGFKSEAQLDTAAVDGAHHPVVILLSSARGFGNQAGIMNGKALGLHPQGDAQPAVAIRVRGYVKGFYSHMGAASKNQGIPEFSGGPDCT